MTIEGVVVGDYQNTTSEFGGYYLQEEAADADANPATSEGVFVFANGFGPDVDPGDLVRARGTVAEFNGLTEIEREQRARKSARPATALPAADAGLAPGREPRTTSSATEGMLVNFSQTLTATEVFNLGRFGEVSLSGDRPALHADRGRDAGRRRDRAVRTQNNRSRIVLDDGNNQQNIDPTRYPQGGLSALNTLRVGDTLPGLTGVMDYRFSVYRIQPVGPISLQPRRTRAPRRPPPVGGNLKVASFNVLNFFNGNGRLDGGGLPDLARRQHAVRVRPPEGEGSQRAQGDERRHRRPDGDGERRARRTARSTISSRA